MPLTPQQVSPELRARFDAHKTDIKSKIVSEERLALNEQALFEAYRLEHPLVKGQVPDILRDMLGVDANYFIFRRSILHGTSVIKALCRMGHTPEASADIVRQTRPLLWDLIDTYKVSPSTASRFQHEAIETALRGEMDFATALMRRIQAFIAAGCKGAWSQKRTPSSNVTPLRLIRPELKGPTVMLASSSPSTASVEVPPVSSEAAPSARVKERKTRSKKGAPGGLMYNGKEVTPTSKATRDELLAVLLAARRSSDYPTNEPKYKRVIHLLFAAKAAKPYWNVHSCLLAAALEGTSQCKIPPHGGDKSICNIMQTHRMTILESKLQSQNPPRVHQLRAYDKHLRLTVNSEDVRTFLASEAIKNSKGHGKAAQAILEGADIEGAYVRGEIKDAEFAQLSTFGEATSRLLTEGTQKAS